MTAYGQVANLEIVQKKRLTYKDTADLNLKVYLNRELEKLSLLENGLCV